MVSVKFVVSGIRRCISLLATKSRCRVFLLIFLVEIPKVWAYAGVEGNSTSRGR